MMVKKKRGSGSGSGSGSGGSKVLLLLLRWEQGTTKNYACFFQKKENGARKWGCCGCLLT